MAKRRRRRMFTAAKSAEVWDRWQRREGLKLIGRVFGRTSSAIFQHLKPHGGNRPVPRRRSRRALSLADREEITRGIAAGGSLRSIAAGHLMGDVHPTFSKQVFDVPEAERIFDVEHHRQADHLGRGFEVAERVGGVSRWHAAAA